ncbi:MAG TPA: glycosyltransferase family 2 protein [Solirubrobacteraceae bacterium]|nr:glycosyltransferase family 2 protein [Solirubrobacteraceae bacterium]
MTEIAVVIPSWNTAAHIERCVAAAVSQEGVEVELLVVENGSRDGSSEVLRELGVPLLELQENVGFARAVNLGAARTRAPFVLVLNADCFLAAGCALALSQALAADPGLGGTQPRIVQAGPGPPVLYSAGQLLTRHGSAFERGWGEPDGADFDDGGEVFGVSGAACLLRRELFADLGGYDETYFAFYEDVDLNARARLAGWRFAYVPDARAVHVGHAGWGGSDGGRILNVERTVRNRLATALKVLPPGGVAGALALTARTLAASPFRHTARAALAGALAAIRAAPGLLAQRRRLRAGSCELLDGALVRGRGRGPDPRRA